MSDVRLRAWQRWQSAAGPWRGWAICPALSMPTEVVSTHSDKTDFEVDVQALASTVLDSAPTALIVDLDPVRGVYVGAALNQRRFASVVLLLPRWPHADAVLPSDSLIGALVEASRRVQHCEAAPHVVFVLDGDRSKSLRRPANDPRIDNRYDLALGDLPTLRQLRGAGIERIVKLAPSSIR